MRSDSSDGCIHRLQVIGRVAVETVCDSLLFGNVCKIMLFNIVWLCPLSEASLVSFARDNVKI